MPVPAPRRVGRGPAPSSGGKKKKTPRRTISHKFRAQDFVRKRQNESLTDHYTLGKMLGEGQFGEVFIGTVNGSGKGDSRAIKRIQKDILTEEDHEEVFNEFLTLKQMDHPNICKMYEFFEDKDNFWFVQELCSGGELLDELERTETFSESSAALIMKQVLSSVHYCHSQKHVVHRDLKLENILLEEGTQKSQDASGAGSSSSYNPMIVKVIDFGLATTFEQDQVLTAPVGSMHYIAPEVLEQEYGYKCDIWSCGVIAYILLCGYAPFDAANDRDMRELIMMGNVSFEDPIWQNTVSQEAKEFVSYLMTYEPDKRPDASQALQHSWIQNASKAHAQQFKATKSGTDAAVKFLSNCRSFEAASKLKQATCAFMTSQLVLSGGGGEEEGKRDDVVSDTAMMIGEIFRAVDLDSDGRLSREELRAGFLDFLGESTTVPLTVEEVDDVFQRMDLSFTGYIDYSEFVVACMGLHNQEQTHHQQLLKEAFERLLDKDGSGFISHEKLRNEMAPFYGEDVEEAIIQKIIDQADADQDGQISWGDFQAMMSKTADFVPPPDATPLGATPPAAVKDTVEVEKADNLKTDEATASPAEESSVKPEKESEEIANTEEAPEQSKSTESELPGDATTDTTTSPPPGRKVRTNAGPKARLISAMFEKNLEKNREMGFDQFSYIRKQPKDKGGPKRKLPRTRRLNFEELTKKANTQVNFDARAAMAGRKKEMEQLKANPGRARQRRATIVSMFQQEKHDTKRDSRLQELESLKGKSNAKGRRDQMRSSFQESATRKMELKKREQRTEELKRLKTSMSDDSASKRQLFESWAQANFRPSMEQRRSSRLKALAELKEFNENFEQPESIADKSSQRRASAPAKVAAERSRRSWTKRLSGKSLMRASIQENKRKEGSSHDRRGLDRSSSHTALHDYDEQEERLVEMQPKAKTPRSARLIEPLRRLNSFDSDQEQDERDQRWDDMTIASDDASLETNRRAGAESSNLKLPIESINVPPVHGNLNSSDALVGKDQKLDEKQQPGGNNGESNADKKPSNMKSAKAPNVRSRHSLYDAPSRKEEWLPEKRPVDGRSRSLKPSTVRATNVALGGEQVHSPEPPVKMEPKPTEMQPADEKESNQADSKPITKKSTISPPPRGRLHSYDAPKKETRFQETESQDEEKGTASRKKTSAVKSASLHYEKLGSRSMPQTAFLAVKVKDSSNLKMQKELSTGVTTPKASWRQSQTVKDRNDEGAHKMNLDDGMSASDRVRNDGMSTSDRVRNDSMSTSERLRNDDMSTSERVSNQREARLEELKLLQQQKSGRAKNAREQFEEKIKANLNKRIHSLGPDKSRSMSVVPISEETKKVLEEVRKHKRNSMLAVVPSQNEKRTSLCLSDIKEGNGESPTGKQERDRKDQDRNTEGRENSHRSMLQSSGKEQVKTKPQEANTKGGEEMKDGSTILESRDKQEVQNEVQSKSSEVKEMNDGSMMESTDKHGDNDQDSRAKGGEMMNDGSMIELDHIGEANIYVGSSGSIGVGSIGDLSACPIAEEVEESFGSPRRRDMENSAPELGSPRPGYEYPAPRDPKKHIVTPKNHPRFGAHTPPVGKGKKRLSGKAGKSGTKMGRRSSATATMMSP